MDGGDTLGILGFSNGQLGFELRLQVNIGGASFLKAGRIAVGESSDVVVEEITLLIDAEPG